MNLADIAVVTVIAAGLGWLVYKTMVKPKTLCPGCTSCNCSSGSCDSGSCGDKSSGGGCGIV